MFARSQARPSYPDGGVSSGGCDASAGGVEGNLPHLSLEVSESVQRSAGAYVVQLDGAVVGAGHEKSAVGGPADTAHLRRTETARPSERQQKDAAVLM